jgi:hypothetical protein
LLFLGPEMLLLCWFLTWMDVGSLGEPAFLSVGLSAAGEGLTRCAALSRTSVHSYNDHLFKITRPYKPLKTALTPLCSLILLTVAT